MIEIPTEILGVDFSGAQNAGDKIWIAHARTAPGVLQVESLQRATDLIGNSERDAALIATREYIAQFQNAACGLDFPFSLARETIPFYTWRDWLFTLREYSSAQEFLEAFADTRREADKESKTPFSPLNRRLFRQTFHGLRDIILPLVEDGACALPFEDARPGVLQLVEICPASLLKKEKLYFSYKGKSALQRENREKILDKISARFLLKMSDEIRRRAHEDFEGDALDAILAALCTWRAFQNPENLKARNEREKIEGRVYF